MKKTKENKGEEIEKEKRLIMENKESEKEENMKKND